MRLILSALVLATATSICGAQNPGIPATADTHVSEPLWSGPAPGAKGDAAVDIPTLTTYLPKSNPTHTAIVIAPGGGYVKLMVGYEGADIAKWCNDHGIAAFVLKYRLGPKYHHPVELEDAQRAIRTVRASAAKYGVQTDHIGMWGFSAGGHLTSTAGTHFDAGKPGSADPIERVSSRPDFLVLAYSVILMSAPDAHAGSVRNLLGEHPDPKLIKFLSNNLQVTPQTPPTFLFATTDDATVPVINSVLFYEALVRNKVPAEMHLFRHGKHGVGLAQKYPDLRIWPDLLLHWLVANGWAQAPTAAQ